MKEEGRRKKEEGRRKREEGRGKKEEGRGKKKEERGKKRNLNYQLSTVNYQLSTVNCQLSTVYLLFHQRVPPIINPIKGQTSQTKTNNPTCTTLMLMRRLVDFFGLIEKLCWSGLLSQLTELRNMSLLSCWSNQPLAAN
ncbi:MAG: hypothetical protein HC894_08785 [Microcoleus sp. SM1_3_4]|nr:hypothetical protein [Microcoleus sp. SM1_3_4]